MEKTADDAAQKTTGGISLTKQGASTHVGCNKEEVEKEKKPYYNQNKDEGED